MSQRRFWVPEVIQTSGMDCGPASLKCLLEGFGISVSYGRLREACQTDVDGTAIETLELVARQLGLNAEQIMIPRDHAFLPEAKTLPAIVVVRLPNGFTHFVVVWRRVGRWLQVMDPGTGRRWISVAQFKRDVYQHGMSVPAEGWREWAGSEDNLICLRRRLAQLGVSAEESQRRLGQALADPSWFGLGCLDAAARMTRALVDSGGFHRGSEASALLGRLCDGQKGPEPDEALMPRTFWSVFPVAGDAASLVFSGTVLVRIRGRLDELPADGEAAAPEPLSPELARALAEKPDAPLGHLWRLLVADGLLVPSLAVAAVFCSGLLALIETIMLRSLLDLGGVLGLGWQRLVGGALVVLFFLLITGLHFPTFRLIMGLGRHLEVRLRTAFLTKIPRIGDRYFQSRPRSDMADRLHRIVEIRKVPLLVGRLVLGIAELLVSAVALSWVYPQGTAWAIGLALASLGIPLLLHPALSEVDMRVRSHLGALSRFYLDGLLGLSPLRAHGAEGAMRHQHERLVVEWVRARTSMVGVNLLSDGLRLTLVGACVCGLVFSYFGSGGELAHSLLFVYWAMRVPMVGQFVAEILRQYPGQRNLTLRLLEPFGAPEESEGGAVVLPSLEDVRGIELRLSGVSVLAGGHPILQEISLTVAPGEHVAIVGPSGAGKSSLMGLLLGWYGPATGEVRVDGQLLENEVLATLRGQMAWVDPGIQLWNRSLLENLYYGNVPASLTEVLAQADLLGLLERMPAGLQTVLGEGGALVSGGEGQRVRLGRAMVRHSARCVVLDEPFRGLDRGTRHRLMAQVQAYWAGATLFCVTHDIEETLQFPRVLVIEDGRLVADGNPQVLAKEPGPFSRLLEADRRTFAEVWRSADWRRLVLKDGELEEQVRAGAGPAAGGADA